MIQRVRGAILAAIVLFSATLTARRGRTVLRLDFRFAVAAQAPAQYAYVGDLRPGCIDLGSDPNCCTLYVHTISWLPQTLDVRGWTPFPSRVSTLTYTRLSIPSMPTTSMSRSGTRS